MHSTFSVLNLPNEAGPSSAPLASPYFSRSFWSSEADAAGFGTGANEASTAADGGEGERFLNEGQKLLNKAQKKNAHLSEAAGGGDLLR